MTKKKLRHFEKEMIKIIKKHQKNLTGSKSLNKKAQRIGDVLVSRIKLNIVQARLIDTGNLLNSISHNQRISKNGITINYGSFSVNYAAAWEFGVNEKVQVRAHKRKSASGKVQTVRSHKRQMTRLAAKGVEFIAGKPGYIRPAYFQKRKMIRDIFLGER